MSGDQRINLPEIRVAKRAFMMHYTLIRDAVKDLGEAPSAVDIVFAALCRITDDEFRDNQTRGDG